MSVVDTISNQMATAQNQAQQALNSAMELNEQLKSTLADMDRVPPIGHHMINPVNPDATVDPQDKPGELTITGVIEPGFSLPSVNIVAPQALSDPNFKEFTVADPLLAMPARPDALTAQSPEKPAISMPVIAAAPDYSLPEAPELGTIVIPPTPDFPIVEMFSETFPSAIEAAPIPTLFYSEATYQSVLLDAARVWFLDQIQNGGTGLNPSVAQAIFDRATTRLVDSARDNIEKAADVFAGAGFPRPSGSLRAVQAGIRNELQNRVNDLNNDIMIEQAKLAQANTHFAIDKSLQHETMLLQHFNSVANRSFELARATVTLAIEKYNANVTEYRARLEAYKSAASVYEIVVRASALEVEKYKVVLDAKRIEAGIQATEIENYRSQVEATITLSKFYEVQLQAAKIEADIETMKLEAFRAEVSAYAAEIQAKEAEWGAYRSTIEGEKAKVDIYQAQVDAYRAEILAKTSIIEADKITVDAHISTEQLKLEQVKSQILLYSTDIEKQIKLIEGQLSAYLAKNEVYRSEIDRAKTQALVNVEVAKMTQEAYKFNASVSNSKYHEEARLLTEQIKAGIAGTAQGSEAAATAAAAALSQVNTIAQILGEEAL